MLIPCIRVKILYFTIIVVTAVVLASGCDKKNSTPEKDTPFIDNHEKASDAVRNMKLGWNIVNTLDATASYGMDSETSWGQPRVTRELIRAMADAGFGAIRVPVTWYNHMDEVGNVDIQWMDRVEEVVGYVLDANLYCILNVHHDTGEGSQWLHADLENMDSILPKFDTLWRQISVRFASYGDRLIFEGWNEILDSKNSWNFARDKKAYDAIDTLASTFVTAVRSTGGNNVGRNLIISTYAAASGGVSWAPTPDDVLEGFSLPEDSVEDHLIVEVHSYDPWLWGADHGKWTASCEQTNLAMFSRLEKWFTSKGIPVIIGEFGPSGGDSHSIEDRAEQAKYMRFFVHNARERGIGLCAWVNFMNGLDRMTLNWTFPDLAEAALKAWYGDGYSLPESGFTPSAINVRFDNLWSEYCLYLGDGLDMREYKGFRLELAEAPAPGDFQIKMQTQAQFHGETTSPDGQYPRIRNAVSEILFDKTCFDGDILWNINLQACRSDVSASVKRMALIRNDGTEEEIPTGLDGAHSGWGCTIVSVSR